MRNALAVLLVATILLGAFLLAASARPGAAFPHRLRRLHATTALAGAALAMLALARNRAGVAIITWEGLALTLSASAMGAIFWKRAGRRGPSHGMLVATHALLGAAGAAILIAWAIG